MAALDDFGGQLNWDNLQDWIAANDLPGSGPVDGVTRITGGSQNNIFMLTRGGTRMVLRRPPHPLRPNSNETMRREADEVHKPFDHHLSHLAVHGFLHLVGYDHENDADAEEKEALETQILAHLGIPDPYADRAGAH